MTNKVMLSLRTRRATVFSMTQKSVNATFMLIGLEGCRVYPVILDEEKGIVLDTICDSRNTIDEKEKCLKGKKVLKLLEEIDGEAAKRRS